MAITFNESLKELSKTSKHETIKRIKLINGEVIEGSILTINQDMIEILRPDKGAGRPKYTIPVSSILYISDCEL